MKSGCRSRSGLLHFLHFANELFELFELILVPHSLCLPMTWPRFQIHKEYVRLSETLRVALCSRETLLVAQKRSGCPKSSSRLAHDGVGLGVAKPLQNDWPGRAFCDIMDVSCHTSSSLSE